jgi:hypothetical protein
MGVGMGNLTSVPIRRREENVEKAKTIRPSGSLRMTPGVSTARARGGGDPINVGEVKARA